ncbi:bacterio-opsin activator domain-containing protein [Halobacterium zhouii]|uniref:bacterio-opsin activator domain-containing protein n=1 Tax=Halobacterium zhouii TaxID=2902624 RepID=UPI001E607E6B|nr:bacterio-opsin activator domain-containing protein [Halobacterium zhouii]
MPERLTGAQYERVRRAAETHREDLVVRLGGEVGLRPTEMARARPGDVVSHGDHYLLRVREADGTRNAFFPVSVEHELRKYATAANVGDDEELFDVTARRLQMLVREAGDRAGVDVSSYDLRRHFARSHLEDGVSPHVVQSVGGWDRLESLESLLDTPDRGDVVAAFTRGRSSERVERAVRSVADVGEALTAAGTREAVERAVVDTLVARDDFRFAVLAGCNSGFSRRAVAGISTERADDLLDGYDRAVVDDDDVRVREDGPAPAVVLVPLVYGERGRDLLVAGVETGVSDLERVLVDALGTQVEQALATAEHRRLLSPDTAVELEFRAGDESSLVAALSGDGDCRVSLSGTAPTNGAVVCFLVVEGGDATDAIEFLDGRDAVRDTRLVEDHGDGGFLEVVVAAGPVLTVVEQGGLVTGATADSGTATLTAEVSDEGGVRELVDGVVERFPDVTLAAKREVEQPVESDAAFRERLADRLTDRQASVLQAAYYGGYYEWPRGSTAEELADALDVSSPTLHNHLRKANQKLLTVFFDEQRGG